MSHAIIDFFSQFPPELAVFLLSMLPIVELRGAIPAGHAMGLHWLPTALFAIAGNIFPLIFIVYFIEPVSNWLRKHFAFFDRFFTWLFDRTRKKFYDKHAKWGNLALVIFVAIPLPVTGGWTGALASWLFGIKPKQALPLLSTGVIIAAIIVTILSLGAFTLF